MTGWRHDLARPYDESPDGGFFGAKRFIWDALATELGVVNDFEDGEEYLGAIAARFPNNGALRTALRLTYWRLMDARVAEEMAHNS